ncbi:V-type ATP synthase subunit D [Demequina maris]|uniref:V-type ATP synthase subunit D n=1 Tax=Demequina maris TaxID=1638982 RepID=UPI00078096C5|nr:V-type ATP synthase subunit D [Demequina maris]
MGDVGRAARLRVRRRLAVARHGVGLLERKQRIVAAEHERLLLRADDLRAEWEDAAGEADRWARRAAALDGWHALHAAAPARPPRVTVEPGRVMGIEFPNEARLDGTPPRPAGGGSALAYASRAMGAALEAAVAYAAVRRAAVTMHAELVATRTRRRAIEHRWIPALEAELERIEGALEELEREESLRVRWAADDARPARQRRTREGATP